jgi:hypothetical protein
MGITHTCTLNDSLTHSLLHFSFTTFLSAPAGLFCCPHSLCAVAMPKWLLAAGPGWAELSWAWDELDWWLDWYLDWWLVTELPGDWGSHYSTTLPLLAMDVSGCTSGLRAWEHGTQCNSLTHPLHCNVRQGKVVSHICCSNLSDLLEGGSDWLSDWLTEWVR